jgi:hypothetical protein
MRENIKAIDRFLKVNQRIAESVGQFYVAYLQQVFSLLINVYSFYS